jgi:ribosome-binding protein aMBF1 (putative translation factor)
MSSMRKHTSKIRQQLDSSGDKVRKARLPKKMRIAFKIADAIDALDWGNKDLAEKLGKYQSEISRWLKGDHNFTIDTLSDIEEILGIQLLDLEKNTVELP